MEAKLSSLGYLMDRMGVSTAALARRLHVDASLVSKQRSGNRQLSGKSPYFQKVVEFFLEQDSSALISALRPLAPLELSEIEENTSILLHSLLSDRQFTVPKAYTTSSELLCTAEISLYNKGAGRREAFSVLLDQAEAMSQPGELLFIDTEQGLWLLEDEEYAKTWVQRVTALLDRGFHARIALHFTVETARFATFFRLCSPLIFHRNARWFCHQYYDENIYWFSFFILEHAMSIVGMSMGKEPITTTVFTDTYSILQHKSVVEMVIGSCTPMFQDYTPTQGAELVQMLAPRNPSIQTLYSFLPAPAFVAVDSALFNEILKDNQIRGSAALRCQKANALLREAMEAQLQREDGYFIQILQIAEMTRRANEGFVSTSLSLLSGKPVKISPRQYSMGLKELLSRLKQHHRFRVLLCTEQDRIHLPVMNCWCRGASWLVQMDQKGFRLCENPTMVSAATVALEQGWRRIPPDRKDKEAVINTLEGLITALEKAM